MKIAIEAQRIFRKKKHGMEVVTIELIRHLQKIDKKNEYVIFVRKGDDPDCIQETENFKIVIVPGLSYPDWEQFHLPRAIKKEKPDLVHFTGNTASLFLDMPMVLTLHDIIYLESVSFSGTAYQNIGNLYRRFIVPKILKKFHTIITVSDYERKKIIGFFHLEADRVKTVYNARDDSFRKISDETLLKDTRNRYGLPDNFILFLGNVAPRKNSPGLIDAYSKYAVKNSAAIPLVILNLDKEYVERVLRKSGREGVGKNIILMDYVPREVLPVLYNLSTVFIYPSLREGFGLPIVEAMACGTPVITSDTTSMAEIAGDAALLTDPFDTDDMASKISTLVNDGSLRAGLIQKGFRRAARFSWERTAEEVLEIYNNVPGKQVHIQ